MTLVHFIDDTFSQTDGVAIAASVLAWVIGAYFYVQAKSAIDSAERETFFRKYHIAIAIFAAIVFSQILPAEFVTWKAQSEVVALLNEKIGSVDVNQTPLHDSETLIADLRKMNIASHRYHHTHPTGPSYLTIVHSAKCDIPLLLEPDSDVPNEFWVFYLNYKTTSRNDVGFVKTHALENAKKL